MGAKAINATATCCPTPAIYCASCASTSKSPGKRVTPMLFNSSPELGRKKILSNRPSTIPKQNISAGGPTQPKFM